MYARLCRNVAALALVLLVLCFHTQQASAQCQVAGIVRLGTGGTDGWRIMYPAANATQVIYLSAIATPQYDFVRNISSPSQPGLNLGGGFSSPDSCINVIIAPSTQLGTYAGLYNSQKGWPVVAQSASGPNSAYSNGYYLITWYYQTVINGQKTVLSTTYAWLISGVWTTDAPLPTPIPQAPITGGDGTAASPGQGLLILRATLDSVNASSAAYAITGSSSLNGVLGADGSEHILLSAGSYSVSITAKTTANPPVSVTLTRTVLINAGKSSELDFTMKSDGTGGTVNGGDSPSSGSGGWLADAMNSLFIPQQSSVDALKTSTSGLTSWGPLGVITQLATLGNTPASTSTLPLTLTAPCIVNQFSTCTGAAAPATAPMNANAFTSAPGWSTVRLALGMGVWAVGLGAILKLLIPKFQF